MTIDSVASPILIGQHDLPLSPSFAQAFMRVVEGQDDESLSAVSDRFSSALREVPATERRIPARFRYTRLNDSLSAMRRSAASD